LRAVDVECFAGGFTRGVVEAGFEVVAKRELPGGFGAPSVLANLDLINPNLHYEDGPAERWTVPDDIDFVFGNPPCSAFSALTGMSKTFDRGADSKINACMWALAEFGARTDARVIAFESVQPAFSKGLHLMRALRARVEEHSGKQWTLFHVLQNANALGGPAWRPRYFFLLSRIPFGVTVPTEADRGPQTLREAIGDLETLRDTWHAQPYDRAPLSDWAATRRSASGCVDGHFSYSSTVGRLTRVLELAEDVGWMPGEQVGQPIKRYFDRNGKMPVWAEKWQEKMERHNWIAGPSSEIRWDYDRLTRVVDGATGIKVIHPNQPRFMTMRECARIQGFPDDWKIAPLEALGRKPVFYWGKGIPVDAGRWLGEQVMDALEGNPREYSGVPLGEREFAIDVSYGKARLTQREKRCIQVAKQYPTFTPTPAPEEEPVSDTPTPPFSVRHAGPLTFSTTSEGVTINENEQPFFMLSLERARRLGLALIAEVTKLESQDHNPEEEPMNIGFAAQATQPPVLQAAHRAE